LLKKKRSLNWNLSKISIKVKLILILLKKVLPEVKGVEGTEIREKKNLI